MADVEAETTPPADVPAPVPVETVPQDGEVVLDARAEVPEAPATPEVASLGSDPPADASPRASDEPAAVDPALMPVDASSPAAAHSDPVDPPSAPIDVVPTPAADPATEVAPIQNLDPAPPAVDPATVLPPPPPPPPPQYLLDEDGNPVLDDDGNPVLAPPQYLLDEDGNPVLDADGNPVLAPPPAPRSAPRSSCSASGAS